MRATYAGLEYEPEPIVDTPWSPGGQGAYQGAIPYRQPRPVRPFDRLAITPYTRRAVAEILWDGMRQQYYRVKTEIVVETNRASAPNEFLAPVTRMAVALEFIRGYKQHFGRDLTPAQNAELARWQ